jgi:hypothetical protein
VDNNPALSNNDEIPRMGGKLVPPFTFDLPLPSGSWLRLCTGTEEVAVMLDGAVCSLKANLVSLATVLV